MIVVPAIIPHDREQLETEIKKVYKFAHLVQIDISDGIFTPIKTWPYNARDVDFFEQLKKEEVGWPKWQDVQYEIHLMVKSPENILLDWIHTGASGIIAHIEATDDFQKVIDICRGNNVSVGLAIKPSTDIEKIKPFMGQVYPVRDREGSQRGPISNGIDFVQCMGSDTLGKHGAELEEKAIEQIKKLHSLYPESIIAIDIGVNEDTASILISAGATKFISGGSILEAENPEKAFRYFQSLN